MFNFQTATHPLIPRTSFWNLYPLIPLYWLFDFFKTDFFKTILCFVNVIIMLIFDIPKFNCYRK